MNNITKRLSVHTADLAVLYVKLHNYHWHVEGIDFKPVHEMIESYYETISDFYDSVAERILQLNEKAPSSMKEYLAVTGIEEETNKSFKSVEALKKILADFEYLVKEIKVTRIEAADSNDASTDGILSGIIEYFDKQIWMLKSALK
ncbi:Dps family protein [Treponema putidum]|uniref:DNA starvation/stationary phase protection protein n=1 Tax=Treponema putidum TaxID=221027 RepID=A0AAE9MVW0_9SPIR|nr:DNA starvation/stationary phase protection protein [Treponema putidum]AIN93612.1 DNA polymerase III subunit beta [Treponema putidum]TWI75493.1 starvation-inducible DNA-binding protein [Treponema putidum]UTY29858.1 DNA starvation/stationary phase protection protein [Treponema putidum]UTY32310.1 DNA starvation/stationary phase protection protein [Treponema putidum]UTY34716.1 DNA starvation/stationary phase protection protein [Treponema putidum]